MDENGTSELVKNQESVAAAVDSSAIDPPEIENFKYKYKEAAPAPPGVSFEEWNRIYTAADSRNYNKNGKSAKVSGALRKNGETRVLALSMLEDKRAKANSQRPQQRPRQQPQQQPPTTPSSLPTAEMDAKPTKKVPTAGFNKAIKLESSSRDGTPNAASEPATTIAEKVKGKSRTANKRASTGKMKSPEISQQGSSTVIQQPSEFFGREDVSEPHPFTFGPTSLSNDSEDASASRGDSKLTDREEFQNLGDKFEGINLAWETAHPESDVNARDASDFVPEEKSESGALKRYAGFEPFVRVSDSSNTPAPKPPKKKTNRGRKKSATAKKKKAAANESKEKAKSAESAQEEDDSDSSNDGGVYCICRGPDDHRKMIACDLCDEWYHCSCVGVKEEDILLIDKYICEKCFIDKVYYTTWKPMCRLSGCRMPCDLSKKPPSKYCSEEHKREFFENAISRAPDGPEPSRGGPITKSELKALLESKKGDVKGFHALGKKPTLPGPPEQIDWQKILTDEEKGRLAQIAIEKIKLKERSQGFKDKEKVIRMAMDRLKRATEAKKELSGVCGWDARLAMNQEEFDIWRKSESGVEAFRVGSLDGSFCDKKRCTRHAQWVKLSIQDARFEDLQVVKAMNKLRSEEHAIKETANTRAASES